MRLKSAQMVSDRGNAKVLINIDLIERAWENDGGIYVRLGGSTYLLPVKSLAELADHLRIPL